MNCCSEQIEVPPALPGILKKYSKEVIRYNPKDIILFSRDYFTALANGDLESFLAEYEEVSINTRLQATAMTGMEHYSAKSSSSATASSYAQAHAPPTSNNFNDQSMDEKVIEVEVDNSRAYKDDEEDDFMTVYLVDPQSGDSQPVMLDPSYEMTDFITDLEGIFPTDPTGVVVNGQVYPLNPEVLYGLVEPNRAYEIVC